MKKSFAYITGVFIGLTFMLIFAYLTTSNISMLIILSVFLAASTICGGITVILSELEKIQKKLGISAPEEKELGEK